MAIRLKRLNQADESEDALFEIPDNVDLPNPFVLTRGSEGLCLYSEERWEIICQQITAHPDEDMRDALVRTRIAPSQTSQIENQQVKIPQVLLEYAGIAGCDLALMYEDGKGTLSPSNETV